MTLSQEPRPDLLAEPSARTFQLANLVAMVREGRVRVPHFQRGLRWTRQDAVRLIDSVLRGFPIGSLLLWRRPAPADRLTLGQVRVDAPEVSDALYVVDGQQRITTFVNVLDPRAGVDGDFALVYDLKERPFRVRASVRNEPDDHAIPLPVLFDLPKLLRWISEHPQYSEIVDEINAATQRLREFHVPAYEVRSQDDEVLREIYDRMNSSGKRLSRAEAFWGLYAPKEGQAQEALTLDAIGEDVSVRLGWGRPDPNTVLHAFLARRGPDTTRDIHLEFREERRTALDFPAESQEQAHERALEALGCAIEFLRDEVGVPHFTFLAYRYLLVALTRFFAHFPEPDHRNKVLLRRWYWRAALAGPGLAGGSATGAARTLAACIQPGDENGSVQRLLAAVDPVPKHRPNARSFGTNRASGHIMLCALWSLSPRSPDTGEPFLQVDLAQEIGAAASPRPVCPELLRRQSLPPELRNSLGNRVLAPGVPEEALIGLAADGRVRASHLIPDGPLAPQVVEEREVAAQDLVDRFLQERTEEGMDCSPPLHSLELDDDDEDDDTSRDTSW